MYMNPLADADHALLDRPQPQALLARLCGGASLSADEAQILFQALVAHYGGVHTVALLARFVNNKRKHNRFARVRSRNRFERKHSFAVQIVADAFSKFQRAVFNKNRARSLCHFAILFNVFLFYR